MKYEAEGSSETFMPTYQTIPRHVPVDSTRNIHGRKNLKFQKSHNQ
jgi:hypothetical protein